MGFYDERTVSSITTLSPSTLRRMWARGAFPAPVSLGERRRAWVRADVDAWIAEKAGTAAA